MRDQKDELIKFQKQHDIYILYISNYHYALINKTISRYLYFKIYQQMNSLNRNHNFPVY